jgi:predicted nucleotidyltransferase
VFGSATGSDFDEESSDIDLLVEFEDVPYAEVWLEDTVLTPDG